MKENKIYVLNPYYHLRNDKNRVSLFSKGGSEKLCSTEWHSFIHPLQAWVLCQFTYARPISENIDVISKSLGVNRELAYSWITQFYDNPNPLYIEWQGNRICFPKKLLVDAKADTQYRMLSEGDLHVKHVDLQTQKLFAGPLMITLMLTNRCVTHCEYCYADTKHEVEEPLSTKRILQLVDQAARLHVRQVNLIGGEVFIHPDWQQILAALVKRRIAPAYLSTKMPLDVDLISRIKKTGYEGEIQVSLDTLNEKILLDTLHVRGGYCKKMLEALQILDSSGLRYHVSSVLTKANCNFEIMHELWRELAKLKRLADWRIVPVSNSSNVEYKKMDALKADKEQVLELCKAMSDIICLSPFPILFAKDIVCKQYRDTTDARFIGERCSALRTHFFILPDGKVTICEQLYWHPRFIIGDVRTNSLRQVWNSEKADELSHMKQIDLSDSSACKKCLLFENCYKVENRCWSDVVKAYGKNHWDYPDPRCKQAPKMSYSLAYL